MKNSEKGIMTRFLIRTASSMKMRSIKRVKISLMSKLILRRMKIVMGN
jgi:hypothetical protein